jgi:hypothetical protein
MHKKLAGYDRSSLLTTQQFVEISVTRGSICHLQKSGHIVLRPHQIEAFNHISYTAGISNLYPLSKPSKRSASLIPPFRNWYFVILDSSGKPVTKEFDLMHGNPNESIS